MNKRSGNSMDDGFMHLVVRNDTRRVPAVPPLNELGCLCMALTSCCRQPNSQGSRQGALSRYTPYYREEYSPRQCDRQYGFLMRDECEINRRT